MTPTRFTELPDKPALVALTATGRGMMDHALTRAARQAYGELMSAVVRAGLIDQVACCIALLPDKPKGPNDPRCRYLAGVVFGLALPTLQGECRRPEIPLQGSLAWTPIAPGRYAVFTHVGPYDTLYRSWVAVHRDWLPRSGERLRPAPAMEISLNDGGLTPPAELLTEIWLPLV
jgi:AraC family transcriptional regulator